MRSKLQKKSKDRLAPAALLRPNLPEYLKQVTEEEFMTVQSHHADTPDGEFNGTDSMFDLFAQNEGFWWPFRAVSKALLLTQRNSTAYIEANRRLIDEMRNIIRKEQDLVLELSETALSTAFRAGTRNDERTSNERDEVTEVFDRAATGIRELSEAWIDAQVRSLDLMRDYNDARRKRMETVAEAAAEAA